jgi:hypothetical protein
VNKIVLNEILEGLQLFESHESSPMSTPQATRSITDNTPQITATISRRDMEDNVIRMPNVHPKRNVSMIFSIRIFMGHLLDFSQAVKPAYLAPVTEA